MTTIRQPRRRGYRSRQAQRGVVLYIALILLVLLAMIGVIGMQVAGLQERMAGNYFNTNLAFQSAEADVRLRECFIEGVVNRTGACGDGMADIVQICDSSFDATSWAEDMSVATPQGQRVSIRSIGPCISGNSSLAMGRAPVSEDPNPVYQITSYATNPAATASAAIDTIFRP